MFLRFISLILSILIFVGIPCFAQEEVTIKQEIGGYPELLQLHIPFNGAWRPGDNPLLLELGDFADIKNMRYTNTGIEGVSGYSKINTAPFYGNYNYSNFTETDIGADRVSVAAHVITVTNLDTDEDVYVHYDEGAAFFSGDFEHDLEFKCTTATGIVGPWALSNDDPANGNGLYGLANNDLDHLSLRWDTGSNLVTNGDMELDSSWSNYNSPPINERSSTPKHGGSYSRKFTSDYAGDGIISDSFTVVSGVEYSVIVWVYPASGTQVAIIINDGTGQGVDAQNHTGLIQNTWNKITFSYTETSGGSNANTIIHDFDAGSGTWYIDDVSIKPYQLILQETNGATDTTDASTGLAIDTDYYLTIERDETVGAFGTLYAYIYSDSARETLVDTLTVTLTEKQDFQYIFGQISYDSTSGGSAWSGTISNLTGSIYDNILSGYYFRKDQPSETHIFIQSADKGDNTVILGNKAVIPDQGNFENNIFYTELSGASTGRFAPAAQGHMIYCNTIEVPLIWGGDEAKCMAFIGTTAAVTNVITNPRDYTSQVQNTLQTTSEIVSIATPYMRGVIGAPYPLKGVKWYVKTANDTSSTLNFQEWTGTAWSDLTETDGTTSGGIALAQTGVITWSDTQSTSKKKYLDGTIWYWYQWILSAGTAEIYYVTLDAAIQPITNIWDQTPSTVSACLLWNGTTFEDYSDEVNSEITTDVLVLNSLAAGNYVLLGFETRQQGFVISIAGDGGKENSTANTALTIYYHDGDSYVAAPALNDGTSQGAISLARSGVVTFTPPGKGVEFRQSQTGEDLLFYYKLTWNQTIDIETEVYYISGISAPEDILPYEFPLCFQNRILLCNKEGAPNKILISAENAPYIFNGPDSTTIQVGLATDLIAGISLSNSYESSIDAVAIACKKSETWALREPGDGSPNYIQHQLSQTLGCVAPLTMDTCELTESLNLAIWLSHKGPILCDGVSVKLIPGIEPYFNPTNDLFLGYSTIENANGFFDLSLNEYNIIIGSNWLVWDLTRNKWFKKEPPQYPQRGWQVQDTHGGQYTYLAFSDGYMRRNEHSNAYDGTDINQSVTLSDISLAGLWFETQLDFLKLCVESKAGDELVVNGDMELDSNWSNANTPPINERSSTQKHGDSHSRKFTSDYAGDGIKSDSFTVVSGDKYSVIVWVYPASGAEIAIQVYNGDGIPMYAQNHTGLTQNAWNEISFNYTEDAGGSNAKIMFFDYDAGAGTWYIDDVSIKPYEDVDLYYRGDGDKSWIPLTSVAMYESGKKYKLHTQRPSKRGVTHHFKFEVATDDIKNGFCPLSVDILYRALRTSTTID